MAKVFEVLHSISTGVVEGFSSNSWSFIELKCASVKILEAQELLFL